VANRVSVSINVNDNSRAALASLRQNMRRMQRDAQRAGGTIRFNVRIPDGATRREIRRIQRALRNQRVTFTTRLDPPTPSPRTLRQRILRGLGGALTVPVRLATRGMVGSVRGAFRTTGRVLGGILQEGLGQGIVNGFKAAGPVGMAVLSAIILGSLSALGAAMAGLLVLAFGGAFVALGVYFASQSEVIQRNWKAATKNMGEDMRRAAEPLIPVVHEAIHQMERMVDALGVKLREFFAEAAPQLTDFLESLEGGFRKFGEKAWEPMTEAFRVFLDAFGPQWEGFMEDLGSSFGALGRTVSSHSTEIALGLRAVLGIIVLLVDLVNLLANTWVQGIRVMTFAWGLFLKAMGVAVGGFLSAIDVMLAAIEPVAKLIGMGDAVKAARRNIAEWGEGVQQGLSDAGQQAMDFGKTLDRANRKRQLEVNIESFRNRLAIARADLKKTADKKARAKIQADITDLNNKIARARRELNNLNGKVATTYVNSIVTTTKRSVHEVVGKAHGGVVGSRAATGGVRSNMTLVGEAGPELVDLPTGSRVRSNPDSRRMMGGGGGGGPAVIEIRSGGSKMDDLLVEILRKAVHVRGGDVQVVLGKGS
jgi:hypothetical protein